MRKAGFLQIGLLGVVIAIGAISIFFMSWDEQNDTSAKNVLGSTTTRSVSSKPLALEKATKIKVGIQAGHWKVEDLPEELQNLKWNFGAQSGGYTERDIVLKVSNLIRQKLEDKNIEVDILPATIPAGYKANAFVSIHADGNDDHSVSGYKTAGSSFDETNQSTELADLLSSSFGKKTGLRSDPSVSEEMRSYYAFNFQKYHAAISPETPGAIIEIGYITNSNDRRLLINRTDDIAQGITEGLLSFLLKD